MLGCFGILVCWPQADVAERFFEPACALFRLWLAAVFAPGFIALPLKMPPMSLLDCAVFLALLLGAVDQPLPRSGSPPSGESASCPCIESASDAV